jgi:hypothetical protein
MADDALYLRESSLDLQQAIAARLQELDHAIAHIEHLKKLAQAEHTLPESVGLIHRYEAHNNRQMKQAIEQLQALQTARAITSNGNNEPRLKVV